MPEKTERKLIEDYVAEKLQSLGWKFVKQTSLDRQTIREPLLIENLKRSIIRINNNLGISEEEIKKVSDEVNLLTSGQEGVKDFLYFLKYGIRIKFEKERVVKTINLFDYENIKNNEFLFSRQVYFRGKDLIIPDIILFVNGIPLVNIECKSPTSLRTGWKEGYDQVKQYENLVPEVYKYIQIGISFAERVRYFPIVSWQENVSTYLWRRGELPEDEAIFEILEPPILLDILRNFLFIREEYSEVKKVITRYMQYRAANKIYQRVIYNLEGKTEKNKGLIWHWQGSGKTLTMIFSAHKLFFEGRLEKPPIFFVVDRRDLEEQMNAELSSLKLNFSFEKIENIKQLKEIFSYDKYRGKRGVFLTLIHKFSPDEKFVPEEFFEEIGLNRQEIISERKNIICFLDEVHRSQYGLLAAQMKKVLKNAFFFGFTGTPIAEDERNTYLEFGYPLKEEGYLDRYFIEESQKDGFTLPLVYISKVNEIKEQIDENNVRFFLEKASVEDLGDIEQEVKRSARKKLNQITVFLENENRIDEISRDISEHFKENLDERFKAMVVCGSRKACVFYKKYLDKYLPKEYSEVVMTFGINDKYQVKSFYKEWKERYSIYPDDEHRVKKIVESFKEKDLPKILIVTDMLITGFDAPILQVMYLDKLLKKHKLLQAIARTNRPYNEVKLVGIIIDYVGILKKINFALRQYYKENIEIIVEDFLILLELFKKMLQELEKIFTDVKFEIKREYLIKAINILRDEENERKFLEKYLAARKLFETLGSYQEKIQYLEKFKWFTAVYNYRRRLIEGEPEKELIEKYFRKTLEIIHKETEIQRIEKLLPKISLNADYLLKIKESALTTEEKAVNILFALEKLVLVHQSRNPIYKTIMEQLKELIRRWKEREIEFQELFKEENKLLSFIEEKEKERKDLNFSPFEFGIFTILNKRLRDKDINKLKEFVMAIIENIKEDLIENWIENPTLRQNIERKLRSFALLIKKSYELTYNDFDSFHKELVSFINDYAAE